MRKIQIERMLFELFGQKFLVFENFKDNDLDIDDKSIYQFDRQDSLVELFFVNQFFSIWNDERRHNASVICACHGNLNLIIDFLKKIGVPENCYSTFNCDQKGDDRVLYLNSSDAMHIFTKHLSFAKYSQNRYRGNSLFSMGKN